MSGVLRNVRGEAWLAIEAKAVPRQPKIIAFPKNATPHAIPMLQYFTDFSNF